MPDERVECSNKDDHSSNLRGATVRVFSEDPQESSTAQAQWGSISNKASRYTMAKGFLIAVVFLVQLTHLP